MNATEAYGFAYFYGQRLNAHTGWIRYRIHDKASTGKDKWIFAPGLAECGEEAICDYIVRHHESWAQHAERYNIDYFTTELPPAERIRGRILATSVAIKHKLGEIKALKGQLARVEP